MPGDGVRQSDGQEAGGAVRPVPGLHYRIATRARCGSDQRARHDAGTRPRLRAKRSIPADTGRCCAAHPASTATVGLATGACRQAAACRRGGCRARGRRIADRRRRLRGRQALAASDRHRAAGRRAAEHPGPQPRPLHRHLPRRLWPDRLHGWRSWRKRLDIGHLGSALGVPAYRVRGDGIAPERHSQGLRMVY